MQESLKRLCSNWLEPWVKYLPWAHMFASNKDLSDGQNRMFLQLQQVSSGTSIWINNYYKGEKKRNDSSIIMTYIAKKSLSKVSG